MVFSTIVLNEAELHHWAEHCGCLQHSFPLGTRPCVWRGKDAEAQPTDVNWLKEIQMPIVFHNTSCIHALWWACILSWEFCTEIQLFSVKRSTKNILMWFMLYMYCPLAIPLPAVVQIHVTASPHSKNNNVSWTKMDETSSWWQKYF